MKLDYKTFGQKLAVISIVCLSTTAYYGEVLAGGCGDGGGQNWGNFLGDHSNLMKASDTAGNHTASESVVALSNQNHILDFPDHYDADGNHIDGMD